MIVESPVSLPAVLKVRSAFTLAVILISEPVIRRDAELVMGAEIWIGAFGFPSVTGRSV